MGFGASMSDVHTEGGMGWVAKKLPNICGQTEHTFLAKEEEEKGSNSHIV